VKKIREEAGLTQDQLAKKLGHKDRSKIAHWESEPGPEDQVKLNAIYAKLHDDPHNRLRDKLAKEE